MATRSVTVNAVAPGYIETATVNVLDQSLKDTLMTWIPMERFGQPDEIACLVNFLASESASYITGEIIRADGGMAI
jgi:3-oxoacyl-[acyl-carrier protein] reductase